MTMTTPLQEVETFYNDRVENALENCQKAGYQPLFMPQLAEARINGTVSWNKWYTTSSIRATGKTKQGNAVVVYAHIPSDPSNPANIKAAKAQGLVNYAARISQDEFQRLVDAEDKKDVWVVDYNTLRKSTSNAIKIKDALKHPQTIPFLGGQERAERYLEAHAKAYDTNTIGVWHADDLDEKSPLARLLYLGDYVDGGLDGYFLNSGGRFAGVRQTSAEGAAQKIVAPTLDQLLQFSTKFVPDVARKEYEAGLRKLYKQ